MTPNSEPFTARRWSVPQGQTVQPSGCATLTSPGGEFYGWFMDHACEDMPGVSLCCFCWKFVTTRRGVARQACKECNNLRSEIGYANRVSARGRRQVISFRQTLSRRFVANSQARFGYAGRVGKISKPPHCSLCGRQGKIEGHHEDYRKPMEVVWVCRKCHVNLHIVTLPPILTRLAFGGVE
jgi:hypothetical protein